MSVEVGESGRPDAPQAACAPAESSLPGSDHTAPVIAVGPRADGLAAPPFPHTPDFLLDVQLSVSVEVGRIQMPVRQVMELGPGAVIELQRSAAEPVEIHANGRCIGRGEIVVVGEQFGVRITELGPA
jgi:flagellar motor switch protein FliN